VRWYIVANVAGEVVLGKLRKMRNTQDDETVGSTSSVVTSRPAWMVALKASAQQWLKNLPKVSL
jgi:hypothetical protein